MKISIVKVKYKDLVVYAIQKKKWFKKPLFYREYKSFPISVVGADILPFEPLFIDDIRDASLYTDITTASKSLAEVLDSIATHILIMPLTKIEEEFR